MHVPRALRIAIRSFLVYAVHIVVHNQEAVAALAAFEVQTTGHFEGNTLVVCTIYKTGVLCLRDAFHLVHMLCHVWCRKGAFWMHCSECLIMDLGTEFGQLTVCTRASVGQLHDN